jgi:hypothetical protein
MIQAHPAKGKLRYLVPCTSHTLIGTCGVGNEPLIYTSARRDFRIANQPTSSEIKGCPNRRSALFCLLRTFSRCQGMCDYFLENSLS